MLTIQVKIMQKGRNDDGRGYSMGFFWHIDNGFYAFFVHFPSCSEADKKMVDIIFECITLDSNIFVLVGLLVMFHKIIEGIAWGSAFDEQRIGD